MKFVARFFISTLFFSLFLIFSQFSYINAQEAEQERELVSIMLHTANGSFLYEKRPITLNLNGEILPEADMPPIIIENRTFVPVRHVLEAMGAIVDFHLVEGGAHRIMVAYGDNMIVMNIGQYYFHMDEMLLQMDVAPQIINERTLVPVSFIANALGFEVYWENESATVYLTSPEEQNAQEPVLPIPEPAQPQGDNGGSDTHHNDGDDTIVMEQDRDLDFMSPLLDVSPGPISRENNPQTTIHHVSWNDARTQFAITAAGRISYANWQMLEDGRLFVDIHNAVSDFSQATHTIGNGFLRSIRTGQNVANGTNISRVVFDLTTPVAYAITISDDRQHILVTFEQNVISHINFTTTTDAQGQSRETIVITGSTAPAVDVFVMFDPLRLVVDIPNAELTFDGELNGTGNFINDLRFSQFDENTVRIVAELGRHPSFDIQLAGNTATIHISEPTFRNIYYNAELGRIEIVKPPTDTGFDINQILEFERYLERRHLFVMPDDFSAHFGYGEFTIRHQNLRFVDISTEGGMTTFDFNTSQIMAFEVTQDAERIFIRPIHPRERYSFIVLIDPGHGGSAPGAIHHGMRETDINLDTSLMVLEMLRADGLVRAYTTRYTDVTVANSARARMANEVADIFVSIHYNGAINTRAQGTETLYYVTPEEAGRPGGFNSRTLAQIMQNQLLAELGSVDRGLRNRPGILILNQSHVPTVLLEIGFMSNPEEAALIANPAYRRRAAEAIVRGIYEAAGVYAPRQ